MQTISWKYDEAPQAPFIGVIFISKKSKNLEGYKEMDQRMMEMAQEQEGYLGYANQSGVNEGIFISFWKDEASIQNWRDDKEHGEAKSKASSWYSYYHSMICEVKSSKILNQLISK